MINYIQIIDKKEVSIIDEIVKINKEISKILEKTNKADLFFSTGKNQIENYLENENNVIYVALENKIVLGATFILVENIPYSYNDLSKYFRRKIKDIHKYTKKQKEYIYKQKLLAFDYAANKIKNKTNENIYQILEKIWITSRFLPEFSTIVRDIQRYMYEYLIDNNINIYLYNDLYHLLLTDLSEKKNLTNSLINTSKYYEIYLKSSDYKIINYKCNKINRYKNCIFSNTIIIDTYVVNPNFQNKGVAKKVILKALEKKILSHYKNPVNDELFIALTVHPDNIQSIKIAAYFQLLDYVTVEKNDNVFREVRICKITKNNYQEYLNKIQIEDLYLK